jgi:hypothetical protein
MTQLGGPDTTTTWCLMPRLQRDALWIERRDPKGWRCMTCHPPDHPPAEMIRREGEVDDAPVPAAPGLLLLCVNLGSSRERVLGRAGYNRM